MDQIFIDMELIEENILLVGRQKFLRLVSTSREKWISQLNDLEVLLERKSQESGAVAHSLAGSLRNVGLERAGVLFLSVENAIRRSDYIDAEVSFDAAKLSFFESIEHLYNYIDGLD